MSSYSFIEQSSWDKIVVILFVGGVFFALGMLFEDWRANRHKSEDAEK